MKKPHLFLVVLSVFHLLLGCQEKVDLEKAIRHSNHLVIGKLSESIVSLDTIDRKDDKWTTLLEFAQKNEDGWSNSVASYTFDYWTGSGAFRLAGWRNGKLAVLSYTDKNMKTVQLTKEIDKGELDFLIE